MATLPKLGEGDVFANRFRVARTLAEGPLGALYEAIETAAGGRRALKLLPPQIAEIPSFKERFAADARPGTRVTTEPPIEVLASGIDEDTGTPWLVTEMPADKDVERFVEKVDPNRAALSALVGGASADKPSSAASDAGGPSPEEPTRRRRRRPSPRDGGQSSSRDGAEPLPRDGAEWPPDGAKSPPPRAVAPPVAKGGSGAGVAIGIAAGLALLAAVGVGAYKFFGAPSLSSTPCGRGTLALIGSLKSPVTVTLYVTGGTPKMDRFAANVTADMRDLEKSAGGKLVYKLVLVTTSDIAAQAKEAGLQEQAFGEDAPGEEPSTALIHRGFCGMTIDYHGEKEVIPYLDPTQTKALPFWVTGKIREVRARADDLATRFGVVAGKGGVSFSEPSLVPRKPTGGSGPSMKGIFAQALPYYKLEDLDLRGGEAEIDPTYSGVIVLQPDADFSDKELRRIDQFLMRGKKSVVVIASAVNVKPADASMRGEIGAHGLDRLLDGYGIEMAKDLVQDPGHEGNIPYSSAGGEPLRLRMPGLLLMGGDPAAAPGGPTLDTTFVPFFRLDELMFPFASSLILHPERQPTARLYPVARSSPTAMSFTGASIVLHPLRAEAPRGDMAPRVLAAALEGKIKSAFAGRPGEGISAPDSAPEDSRVLVLSAAQFPVNPFARAANPAPQSPQTDMLGAAPTDEDLDLLAQTYAQKYLTTTILSLKNTFDWAAADEATVSCSALLLRDNDDTKSK